MSWLAFNVQVLRKIIGRQEHQRLTWHWFCCFERQNQSGPNSRDWNVKWVIEADYLNKVPFFFLRKNPSQKLGLFLLMLSDDVIHTKVKFSTAFDCYSVCRLETSWLIFQRMEKCRKVQRKWFTRFFKDFRRSRYYSSIPRKFQQPSASFSRVFSFISCEIISNYASNLLFDFPIFVNKYILETYMITFLLEWNLFLNLN